MQPPDNTAFESPSVSGIHAIVVHGRRWERPTDLKITDVIPRRIALRKGRSSAAKRLVEQDQPRLLSPAQVPGRRAAVLHRQLRRQPPATPSRVNQFARSFRFAPRVGHAAFHSESNVPFNVRCRKQAVILQT